MVDSVTFTEDLSQGKTTRALLANAIATGSTLYLTITIIGSNYGSHFNPVVTLVMFFKQQIYGGTSIAYIVPQTLGEINGTLAAHKMFELPKPQLSITARTGLSNYFSEIITTFPFLLTILLGVKHKIEGVPALAALYITAAYWVTASKSFENPAVTITGTFSDTFSGINIHDMGLSIIAQIIGTVFVLMLYLILEKDA